MSQPPSGPQQPFTAELLRQLAPTPEIERAQQRVVDLAVGTIVDCTWASMTVRDGKQFRTPAATDPIVDEADQAQYALSQGPCIDAVRAEDTYLIHDTASETRWPQWAPAAHRLGIRSSLSVRLATTEKTVGGLNLYAKTPGVFDDSVDLAQQYAAEAAIVLAVAIEVTTLQSALLSRHGIGAAQGILRRRHNLSLEQAFEVLIRVSRDNNIHLRDLADIVVEENGLPAHLVRTR